MIHERRQPSQLTTSDLNMPDMFLALLFLMLCSPHGANAQISTITKIERIEIDGKETKTPYRVFVRFGKRWIEAKKTSEGFRPPVELQRQEHVSILITFRKHRLEFSDIHISKFNTTWVVGVDKKPFSEEFATTEEAKTIKRLSYIRFTGTGLETQLVIKTR